MVSAAPVSEPIYLDHAAATPLDPRVAEAMAQAAATAFANPSSPHAQGRRARAVLEDARDRILALLGGRTTGPARDRLIFTSGATEANRLGLLGTAGSAPGTVAVSPRDHSSLLAAADDLAGRGWRLCRLSLAADGSALAAAAELVDSTAGTLLVSATLVCGQTGLRESLAALPGLRAHARLLLHADATQAVAWDPLIFQALPVTSLALAPHKFGGPRGIGGLLVRGGVGIAPLTPGPQELGLRGGTEGVALAVGFATAIEIAVAARAETSRRVAELRERLEQGFVAVAARHGFRALVVGQAGDRAAPIATIAVEGCDRQTLVMACDLAGICLATGTACASGSSDPAAAVAALDLPDWVARSAVRASLGATTTAADVDTALERLDAVFRGLAGAGLLAAPQTG